jgi:hypothetical protein
MCKCTGTCFSPEIINSAQLRNDYLFSIILLKIFGARMKILRAMTTYLPLRIVTLQHFQATTNEINVLQTVQAIKSPTFCLPKPEICSDMPARTQPLGEKIVTMSSSTTQNGKNAQKPRDQRKEKMSNDELHCSEPNE